MSALVFEPLAAQHDRQAFDCGNGSLNDFLKRQARQNAERNIGVTHVAVAYAGDARILGYYTLVVRTVAQEIISTDAPAARRLSSGEIGVVLLGRLAVDKTAQGQGIGRRMLVKAMRQVERAAQDMGIFGLVLDALDDQARAWYFALGFGFQELADSPQHLLLPVESIRQALAQN